MVMPQDTYGIILQLRSGKQDNPYVNLSETITVTSNSLAILKEIPDKFYHVQITDSSGNSLYEITEGIPDANEFLVDYNNGNVTFNLANNGKQYTATYVGTGAIYISADRIATQINGSNDIAQTLQDLTDEINTIVANADKDIGVKPFVQTWSATDGETVFTTTNPYNPNNNTLQLYVGGIYQPYSSYTQTDINTITLSEGVSVPSGQTVNVTAVWFMNDLKTTTDITTVSGYGTNIGDTSSLSTTSKIVTGAINENYNKIGVLSNLNTQHKGDLVSAINDNVARLADIATFNNYSTVVTRDSNGNVTQIQLMDGATVIQTTNVTRDSNGNITSVQDIANGQTVTTTINRASDGTVSSVTKVVA